jgi:hypothetical protein
VKFVYCHIIMDDLVRFVNLLKSALKQMWSESHIPCVIIYKLRMEQKKIYTIHLTFVEIKKDEMGVHTQWKPLENTILKWVLEKQILLMWLLLDREQQQAVVNRVQKYRYKLNNLSATLLRSLLLCTNLSSYTLPLLSIRQSTFC